jgi:multiple sugar transport system permease protein
VRTGARMTAKRRKALVVRVLLVASTLVFISPVLWVILMSFRPTPVLVSGVGSILSTDVTLDNYRVLFTQYSTLRFIFNSLIGAAIPAAVAVLVGLFAGYAIVRFQTRATAVFQSMPLFAQVVPAILIVIPVYSAMLFTGLLNTYTGIIVAHTALVLPLAVWMMTGYLQAIPVQIEEAAMVDGCTRVGAVFRVVLPLCLGGVAATAMVAFVSAWGEFLFAFVLLSGEAKRLMSVAVFLFLPSGQTPTTWGLLFAAAVAFMIPSLLLFPILQRLMSKGATTGSLQGL